MFSEGGKIGMSGDPIIHVKEKTLLFAALGCGLLHYYLFFGREWGVSFPLFIVVFYSYYYWAAGEKRTLSLSVPNLLLIPVILLSLTYFLFSNVLFLILNALAVPLLILVHTTWAAKADAGRLSMLKWAALILEQLFVQTVRYMPRPVVIVFQLLSGKMQARRSKELLKVLVGLLLSVPLLFIVISLLASADSMFDRTLSKLLQLFGDIALGEMIVRILWVAVITSGLFAFVCGLLHPKSLRARTSLEERASQWEPPAVPNLPLPRIDPTVTMTMLFMLNIVYLLFAVVQFSYFFGGGGTADLPDGTTYANYARRGFAELVVVTLINLSVMMLTLYGVRRPGIVAWRLLRTLLAVLVGFSGIMLSSAYLRLSMYEQAYGYTVTRILVHAFMIFLLLLFVLALMKLWRESLPLIRYYCIAGLLAYVIVNYANIDRIIARNNVERYESSGKIDAVYLAGLSYEAVPYLLELKQKHPDAPGIDTAIQDVRSRLLNGRNAAWMEFNWSKWKSAKALKAVSSVFPAVMR